MKLCAWCRKPLGPGDGRKYHPGACQHKAHNERHRIHQADYRKRRDAPKGPLFWPREEIWTFILKRAGETCPDPWTCETCHLDGFCPYSLLTVTGTA